VTSFAFAEPSKSSVTVTVVCFALNAILTPQAGLRLIPVVCRLPASVIVASRPH
jgi:hypothetical protein